MTLRAIQPEGLPYPIRIGSGALESLGREVRNCAAVERAVLVTDDNVGPLHAGSALKSLEQVGLDILTVTVPAGEASKSAAQAQVIYDRLAERRHARDEAIIALGGGVVGDLAGFVAATWHRGVPFVQCPTSLEAAIDASIGGKTAINHPAGKNLIGAFHRPILVCIDVNCLATLPDRDHIAALAESVKHAMVRDAGFLDWHEANADAIIARDPDILVELIARNCRIKAEVVVEDERETATRTVGRAALNFGHTIGHAVEAAFEYELRHGEAVALGMKAAMDLAVRRTGMAEADRLRCERLLACLGLPERLPRRIDAAEIIDRLTTDKKVRGGSVRFVVPTGIGTVTWLEDPDRRDLEAAVERIQPART